MINYVKNVRLKNAKLTLDDELNFMPFLLELDKIQFPLEIGKYLSHINVGIELE